MQPLQNGVLLQPVVPVGTLEGRGHKRACETPEQREARSAEDEHPANAPATDERSGCPRRVAVVDASAAVSAAAAVASADDGVSDGDKKAANSISISISIRFNIRISREQQQ